MRNAIAVTVLIDALAATGGCGGNKPKRDRVFPEDYVARLRASLAEVNPSFGESIRQNESPPGEVEEEK